VVLTPGPAIDVGPMISVKSPQAHPKGSLYLTTVYSEMNTTVVKLVEAQVEGHAEVLQRRDVIPPSMSEEDYSRSVMEMMEESKTVAKIVALQKLGYDVQATGDGATVETVLPGNMADGILKVGDIVTAADGQKIQTANDLVNFVRRQKPGSTITLSVKRGSDTFDEKVGTKESDTEPGIAVVGIMIKTYNFGSSLPVQIDIDSENIGGPSAGLMFTLGIMDAIKTDGITMGHKIAGTGTMSLDGKVGPIGGVEQKVIGAEQTGAEYFLAPKDNFADAKKVAHRIQVVQVDTVDDAIAFLDTLKPAESGPASMIFPLPQAGRIRPAA
jgi:Lon-like protease